MTVAVERPLSVEVLVKELKREPASVLIITTGQKQRAKPCHLQLSWIKRAEGPN